MKEDYIVLPFSLPSPIAFRIGDWVDLTGVLDESLGGMLSKRYEITEIQKPTYNDNTGGYDYKLKLNAYYWKWKNKIFKYTPEHAGSEASWSLTATLDVQLGVFLRNLKALGYLFNGQEFTFEIDSSVENKAVPMVYDNMNLLDALFSMASKDKWNCDCWVTDNVIHFGRNEYGDSVKLELGVEASAMTHSESKGTYATRIYAFGSTRNIPANYRPASEQAVVNGVVQKRLMLPVDTPYIDAYEGMSQEEAIEDIVVFDDVYPRRMGTLSNVKTVDRKVDNPGEGEPSTFKAYQYKDAGLIFKKEYILEEQELEVTFQSGKLNGMKFGVVFEPEGASKQTWEIVANEDYGRLLPDETIYPANGDKYVLTGFNIQLVSDQYIPSAEKELKEKAIKYAGQRKRDDGTYNTTLNSVWVYEDKLKRFFEFGQKVNLVNKAFFETGRESRILGWELNLDIPWDSPSYVIGESMPYSRIGEIEGEVESLTYKGQAYAGGGNGVYLIKTNDRTAPSNSNAFSAKRTLISFLNKDRPDQTGFLQKFLGGLITSNLRSEHYVSGALGTGMSFYEDADTGASHGEIDFLTIRRKAFFYDVTIMELRHVGGTLVLSAAAMVVSSVEELSDGYKCFFLNKDNDGRKIYNQFEPDDQVMCRTFNLSEDGKVAANRYWWRLVTEVGEDYIIVSKTDADTGSDIPAVDDKVCLLGNRNDSLRQCAQVYSAYGDDAPSRKMYQGINSYTLVGKDVKSEYYDPVSGRFKEVTYADSYTGNRGKTSYFRFTQEEGVDIAGKVNMTAGSSGAANLTDLPDMIYQAVSVGGENLLRNTSFSGEYAAVDLQPSSPLKKDSSLYSPSLGFWLGTGTIIADKELVSGFSCKDPQLTQSVKLIKGESYVLSFRAKGESVSFRIGNIALSKLLTASYERYTIPFQADGDDFSMSGTCTIGEIKLERGTIATDWCPSREDTDPVADRFKSLWYLMDAIKGNSQTLGGLSLLTMLQLGKFKNGKMEKVNAGVSGIYNEDTDVAFWAGGTFAEAMDTVNKLLLGEQPTDEEWKKLANFVVTHGGNVFLRGYIYALGGYFRGLIDLGDGVTRFNSDGTGWIGKYGANPFIEFDNNSVTVRGKLHCEAGSSLGGLTVTDSGALVGCNTMLINAIERGLLPLDKSLIRRYIIDNIAQGQVFCLAFANAASGSYEVLLPSVQQIVDTITGASAIFVNNCLSLTIIVPPEIITLGDPVANNAHFSIKPSSGSVIYDQNGGQISSVEMEKGDMVEFLCLLRFAQSGKPSTARAEYYIKYLRQ